MFDEFLIRKPWEATETRKKEHDDYVETLAANSAAKDLLGSESHVTPKDLLMYQNAFQSIFKAMLCEQNPTSILHPGSDAMWNGL